MKDLAVQGKARTVLLEKKIEGMKKRFTSAIGNDYNEYEEEDEEEDIQEGEESENEEEEEAKDSAIIEDSVVAEFFASENGIMTATV
jgi:hypothetical protein